jgi:hypothetical protein
MDYMIYEDSPKYNFWIIFIPIFLLLYLGMVAFQISITGFAIEYVVFSLAGLIIVGFVFASRIHRKYQIFNDKLKIYKWSPVNTEIQFKNIDSASEGNIGGSTYDVLLLSRNNSIKIIGKGWERSFTVAPRNHEEFLRRLTEALDYWKSKNPDTDVRR